MTTFRLPDLGEGLSEAELVAWHVNVGDRVVADQPLVSVETDKAVVEVPSPESGLVTALHGEPGDIVNIGAPLVDFAEGPADDSGTVVGRMRDAPPADTAHTKPSATPAVRALAKKLAVDLSSVHCTGPNGRISSQDVEQAAALAGRPTEAQPLHGVRRAMARNMAESHRQVVPATVNDVADISDWPKGTDVTLRLVRAIVAGCTAEPALNAWYLGLDKGRVLHEQINLGLAMDTPDGLFVPVLRDVANREDADLRGGLDAMKADVQIRTVPLEELRGQTITLSNFGMFGGQHAALVVMPPQVAIIGAGRIHQRVMPFEGLPTVRTMLPLSLTFDHRPVMGGEASRFLAAVIRDLGS